MKLKTSETNLFSSKDNAKPLAPLIRPKPYDLKNKPKFIAIDTECTGLNWSKGHRPFSIQMAYYLDSKLYTRYWEFPVDPYIRKPITSQINALNMFTSWYCDPTIEKIFANAKYDMHMLDEAFGYYPQGKIHDVILAAWCCNTKEPSYKLNDLSQKYLKRDRSDTSILREAVISARNKAKKKEIPTGEKVGQDYFLPRFFDHNFKLCQIYGLKDAVDTLDLFYFYLEGMKQLGVQKTYEIKRKNIPVLFKMEKRGVRFFEEECKDELKRIENDLSNLETVICEQLDITSINLNSPKQLCENLFGLDYNSLDPIPGKHEYAPIQSINIRGYTEKGKPSTNQKVLKEYYSNIPIVQNLLEYKGKESGRKYCRNYLENSVPDKYCTSEDFPQTLQGNRASFENIRAIHTTFNQIAAEQGEQKGTRTGRLSSSEPNLHNVSDPTKSTGVFVTDSRKFFGPRKGYRWYCIDYSQIELRIFAERIGGRLKQAFLNEKDPHEETANAVPYLKSMKDRKKARQLGKHTNFTIINMGGPEALNDQYNIPLEVGKELVYGFHEAYPEAKQRQKEAEQFARQNGYIETISGRRIHVDLMKSFNPKLEKMTDKAYQATAYDVQGSAADIILRSMQRIQEYLDTKRSSQLNAHLLLQIHDELVIEVWNKHAYKWFLKKIRRFMEDNLDWMQIPTPVDISRTTKTWSSYDQVGIKCG